MSARGWGAAALQCLETVIYFDDRSQHSMMPTIRNDGRKRMANLHRAALASTVLALVPVENAWAYLDPGTGWMILQGFVAALAAAGVAVGSYWSKVRGWFSRRPKSGTQDPVPPQRKPE
jgi:hypothetical protein